MNAFITVVILTCMGNPTFSDVLFNFQKESCPDSKPVYFSVTDPESVPCSSPDTTPPTANTTTFASFPLTRYVQTFYMPQKFVGQFYASYTAGQRAQRNSTRFIFDFYANYHKHYIMVLGTGDFTGRIDVTPVPPRSSTVAAPGNGNTCHGVSAPKYDNSIGAQSPNQLCDGTSVYSYTITVSCIQTVATSP